MDVQFADILFILLVCITIFVILMWVNKSNKKSSAAGVSGQSEKKPQDSEKQTEVD